MLAILVADAPWTAFSKPVSLEVLEGDLDSAGSPFWLNFLTLIHWEMLVREFIVLDAVEPSGALSEWGRPETEGEC